MLNRLASLRNAKPSRWLATALSITAGVAVIWAIAAATAQAAPNTYSCPKGDIRDGALNCVPIHPHCPKGWDMNALGECMKVLPNASSKSGCPGEEIPLAQGGCIPLKAGGMGWYNNCPRNRHGGGNCFDGKAYPSVACLRLPNGSYLDGDRPSRWYGSEDVPGFCDPKESGPCTAARPCGDNPVVTKSPDTATVPSTKGKNGVTTITISNG